MKVIGKPQLVSWQQKMVFNFLKGEVEKKRIQTIDSQKSVTFEEWKEEWIDDVMAGRILMHLNSFRFMLMN
jgi:hypothetical protein